MKTNELKIFYQSNDGIIIELDEAIEKLLKSFGYTRWASGYNLCEKVRDLAFDKK